MSRDYSGVIPIHDLLDGVLMTSTQTQHEEAQRPAQHQHRQPGLEEEMVPAPKSEGTQYQPAGKLRGKVALITGGDSGIGRAVAIAFAREGADVAIGYLDEHADANETKSIIESLGRRCLLLTGDVGDEKFCASAVARTIETMSHLDILVNNAAEQHPQKSLLDISSDQLERTFRTNIFSYFYMARAALQHLHEGGHDYQYHFSDRLSRQPTTARLFGDKGSDRRLHSQFGTGARETRDSR